MTHLYDYAWAQIPATAMASVPGCVGVVRYLGGSARLTPQERDNLHAAGLAISLVWEQAADMAEHPERGVHDAEGANAEADALGMPRDCVLFYADDHNDPDTSQETGYCANVRSVHGRPEGIYSGGNVVRAVMDSLGFYGWQVDTWSQWGGSSPHMLQLGNSKQPYIPGVAPDSYDVNPLLVPFPMWGPGGTQHPNGTHAPTKARDGMWIVEKRDGGQADQYWEAAGVGVVQLSNGEAYARLAAGIPYIEMPTLGLIGYGMRLQQGFTKATVTAQRGS